MKKFNKIYICIIALLIICIAPKFVFADGNIKICSGGEIKTVDNKVLCVYQTTFIDPHNVECEFDNVPEVLSLEDGSTAYYCGARLNYNSLCSDNNVKSAFKIIGYVILIIKWIVPLIIIVLGMVDFGKASISNDEKALNKATGALIRRIVAGVAIFFIPTIILAALDVIKITKGIEKENDTTFGVCTKCMFDPINSCNTSNGNGN